MNSRFLFQPGWAEKVKNYGILLCLLTGMKIKCLNKTQRKLLKDELIFELKHNEGEFEIIDFMEGFSTVQVMLPLKADLKQTFRNVIDECNQYGDFLLDDMIVTNVKVLSKGEIIQMLNQDKEQDFEELDNE